MQTTLSTQPHILRVWRVVLVLALLPFSFFCSLILRPGSALWWVITALWAGGFLFCYLFYLPAKQRGLSLMLNDEKLVIIASVFSTVERIVPLESVQFVRVRSSLLHRRMGLAALVVVCAGGKVIMPGLNIAQARELALQLTMKESASRTN